jgi:hypothetical protein
MSYTPRQELVTLLKTRLLALEVKMARKKKTLATKIDLNYVISYGFLSQICPKDLIEILALHVFRG